MGVRSRIARAQHFNVLGSSCQLGVINISKKSSRKDMVWPIERAMFFGLPKGLGPFFRALYGVFFSIHSGVDTFPGVFAHTGFISWSGLDLSFKICIAFFQFFERFGNQRVFSLIVFQSVWGSRSERSGSKFIYLDRQLIITHLHRISICYEVEVV